MSVPETIPTPPPADAPPLRLVRPPPIGDIEAELNRVQGELLAVQKELDELRQRDQALKYHLDRLDEELKLAARVQQDFLPRSLPQLANVRFATLFRPAGFVSGDLYDVMRLDESHVGIYMADAVGHGMPAALLTMFLKNALVTKEIFPGGYRLLSPGEAMARLNESLVQQELSQATFATAVYATLDTRALTLTLARGGHPNPLRLTKSGELLALSPEGSLLGIFPGETFEQTSAQLEPGDRIILFSDGVEVAFSPEMPGDTEQWKRELIARRHLPTAQLMAEMGALIDAAGNPPRDDVTMIMIDVA